VCGIFACSTPSQGGKSDIVERIIGRIGQVNQVAAILSAVAILIAMFAVTADVLARKLANQALHGVTEFSELMLVIIIYLAVGLTQIHGRHVRVDVIGSRIAAGTLKRIDILARLVVIFIVTLLAWRTGAEAIHSIEIGEMIQGVIDFPMPPARLSIFAGFVMLLSYIVVDFVRHLLLPASMPTTEEPEEGGV